MRTPKGQLQERINLHDRHYSRLNMDLKVMPKSYKGYGFVLCIIDEVMSYLITAPIYLSKLEEIDAALVDNELHIRLYSNGS